MATISDDGLVICACLGVLIGVVPVAAGAGDSVQTGNDGARGRNLFTANCSACHQASGEGLPGAFPPLKGNSVVNKDDATKHIHVVLEHRCGYVPIAAFLRCLMQNVQDHALFASQPVPDIRRSIVALGAGWRTRSHVAS